MKRINRVLLMRHEHLAGALVELSEIATTSSGAHCILHHLSEACDGAEVMAALKPLQLRHRVESIAGHGCNETLTRNPNPLEDIVTMICYSRPRQFWSICTAVFVGVVSCLIGLPASPVHAADYSVLVGYADLERPAPVNFPTPWDGSPGVIFKGCPGCPNLDAGAVRIVNNTGGTLTVNAVIVRLDTCTFNLWPSNIALPFGGELIVTQTVDGAVGGCTADGHFDTSDVGPGGVNWEGICTNSNIIPQIDVTVNGVTTTYADTGQVLNTGGVDAAECPVGTNESTQWTTIGSLPCPRAILTLTPFTQTHAVGTTATVSATLTNSCGTPLAGVNVGFTTLAGPNVGITHIDTTDRSGNASFSYTSSSSGTDTLKAAVTNLAGTFTSTDVSVTWTNPPSASAAPTPGGGGGGGGGGCSLRPGGEGSPAAYLAALGNIGLPVVVLLVLSVWSWRRQR